MTSPAQSTQDSGTRSRPASSERSYQVRRSELPLSCPTADMVLWNAHPRVYLPIEETGQARCPYCSAHFILVD